MGITSRRAPTAGILAIGTVMASLAIAPGADATTYYACVAKKGGAIHLVARRARCKKSERKISFNSTGIAGRPGANGLDGKNGAPGAPGATGFTSTLPVGATEVGTWAMMTPEKGGEDFSPISFGIPLASAPAATIIEAGKASTPACPGTAAKPQAASGHLCVYAAKNEVAISLSNPDKEGVSEGAGTYGAVLGIRSILSSAQAFGTWAVTG